MKDKIRAFISNEDATPLTLVDGEVPVISEPSTTIPVGPVEAAVDSLANAVNPDTQYVPAAAEGEVDTTTLPPVAENLDIVQVVDSDATMQQLDQQTTEQRSLITRADEMLKLQQSLERYSELVRQAGTDGLSQQAAAFLNVGIKHAESKLGGQLSASLENYTTSGNSAILPATVSVEDLKEFILKAKDSLMEIIEKIINAITDGIESYSTGANKLESKLRALEKRQASERIRTVTESITIKNPSLLFTNGELEFPITVALTGTLTYACKDYPKALAAYYTAIGTLLDNFNPVNDQADEFIEKLTRLQSPFNDAMDDSTILPGNYVVDANESGLSFGLRENTDLTSAPDEVVIENISADNIKRIFTVTNEALKLFKDFQNESRICKGAADKLKARIDKMNKIGKVDGNLDAESIKETGRLVTEVKQALVGSSPRNKELVVYGIRVLNAYLAVIERGFATVKK